ncbi:tumor necrosis factor alpha-induced protein 2-like [Scomber japonicus]|uniref:tumor necrosis factor alpha-induced protein 2-like n=1 Tax=Scomber japonicus TaxID=13676 RepID=UPI002306A086|nr:tumor necrosis factor alpha-induced protein 2-like [Scomber japonicus]
MVAIRSEVDVLNVTVTDREGSLSTYNDDVVSLKHKVDKLPAQLVTLDSKCEARSHHNNIWIIGLPEEHGTVSTLLKDAFGSGKEPVVDRVHRSLQPKPKPGDCPHPIMAPKARAAFNDIRRQLRDIPDINLVLVQSWFSPDPGPGPGPGAVLVLVQSCLVLVPSWSWSWCSPGPDAVLVLMRSFLSSRGQQSSRGGDEENRGGERRRLPRLKIPRKIWKNRKQKNHNQQQEEEQEEHEEEQEEQEEEQLEEISRRLIIREEQLFSQSEQEQQEEEQEEQQEEQEEEQEQEEDELQRELEALRLQILMTVHNTFTSSSSSSSSCSSSSGEVGALRSAVASIQQQEAQDRRWAGAAGGGRRVPAWRPLKCLSSHNELLSNMVESRLKEAAEEEAGGAGGAVGAGGAGGAHQLSSPVKREVCRLGKRVKEDLLTVVRTVVDCYPPHMDVLNVYAGLYQQRFSTRITQLAAPGLQNQDCSYLLYWVNHCYPLEVLKHEELDGKIKTACLGSLLLQENRTQLEDQYLTHTEDKVKSCLSTALKKEEENWLSGKTPELLDHYYFSPLAVDVIQVIDGFLTEFRCVIGEQSKAERITAHLEDFLSSYKTSMEDFVKGNHGNVRSVMKAHLACEEQFRDYITGTGSVSEPQRRRCLDTLAALKDCGYRCLTCPSQLKVCCSQLWTSGWLDGSLPVVDSLLDSLNQQLSDLTHLKPACRRAVLSVLHQDVCLQYVKRMMKTRKKSREQQLDGAQRMIEDAQKINDFFTEGVRHDSAWLCSMFCTIAEILRLQDPGSVQLEMVCLSRTFPDLSDAHVSALLSLKTGLSAADVRSIRRSVEENRPLNASSNHSPPFFSMVKVKWINNKINQMGLKA